MEEKGLNAKFFDQSIMKIKTVNFQEGTFGNTQSIQSPLVFDGLKLKQMNSDFREVGSERTSQAELDMTHNDEKTFYALSKVE